jgi:hypothetical protein
VIGRTVYKYFHTSWLSSTVPLPLADATTFAPGALAAACIVAECFAAATASA